MELSKQPVYLLSDSEILFHLEEQGLILDKPLSALGKNRREISSAYIGASNDDETAFYEIFLYAMELLGITNCRLISRDFNVSDKEFLDQADVVFLSGGDVKKGWHIMQTTAMDQCITRRYVQGALLVGISAGAIQLGLYGWDKMGDDSPAMFETLKIVPFIIDVHDENQHWHSLRTQVMQSPSILNGFGIPLRGGMIYHPDQSIEALRKPLIEISRAAHGLKENLILPSSNE